MRVFVRFLGALLFISAFPPAAAGTIVQESGDLVDEIIDIKNAMPGRDSEGFDVPTVQELENWRAVAGAMLIHDFVSADSLVSAELPDYEMVEFLDTGFQNVVHYLLRERLPVSRGWGTYIVNPNHERSIMVQVPHPRYDLDTHIEGADLFRQTGSRFFLMAGTHRCANDSTSPCSGTSSVCGDGTYHVSDMAHYTDAPFQAVHEVFDAGLSHLYAMSLHGNGRSNCEDIFLSNGHGSGSSPLLFSIKNAVLSEGGLTVAVAGDGSSCPLIGSTNVQGRVTNGSPDPCSTPAAANNGYFIHVEQHRSVREDPVEYGKLISAVNQTIGAVTGIVDPLPVARAITLAPPWPNPGRAATVQLSVTVDQNVTLGVFDVTGRRRMVLFQGMLSAGTHPFHVERVSLPQGRYWISAYGTDARVSHPWMMIR